MTFFLDFATENKKTRQKKQRPRFLIGSSSTLPHSRVYTIHTIFKDAPSGWRCWRQESKRCRSVCWVLGSDSSELVPEAGRHEAFHLVCKESQGCKECAEELRGRWERGKKNNKAELIFFFFNAESSVKTSFVPFLKETLEQTSLKPQPRPVNIRDLPAPELRDVCTRR